MSMEIVEIVSLMLLCIFGIAYVSKLVILAKRNNIRADVFGKGIKSKETLIIERLLKAITFIGVGIWIINSLMPELAEKCFWGLYKSTETSALGLFFTFAGVSFFIMAMVFMKTSWRAGIDKSTRTELVTTGLYRLSRNPAFVGMDLMFIGTAITYGNLLTILVALLVVVGLHFQILQEEKHMRETFGEEYSIYANRTARYILF